MSTSIYLLDLLVRAKALFIFGLAVIPSLAVSQAVTLPSAATEKALRALTTANSEPRTISTKEYKVDPKRLPGAEKTTAQTDANGLTSMPLFVADTLIVQFKPNTTQNGIETFLKERNLEVVQTFPSLGAIKVKGDFSKYFAADLADKDQNQTLLRGVNAMITDFTKEAVVRSASPDLILHKQTAPSEASNLLKPSDISGLIESPATAEAVDWGARNIEADKLWGLPRAKDGVLFGILDVGFGRHRDLVYIDLPEPAPIDDHGTHVAGIACARGAGSRGVLPNCFVRARTGDVFFKSLEGGDVTKFFAVFSQILATLDNFLFDYNDMRVVNVSMGYNWRSNFGINPDDPGSSSWRALVEQQGLMLVTALERASKANVIIYSAAGNDSLGLQIPIQAKYASALNWAAITARDKGIYSGVIVEAHNISNVRADFSNAGGDISCPGVDILSTVAHNLAGDLSDSMYGKMSGTSMASPYCASAHALLSLVRPGYTGQEIARCLVSSSQRSDTGTPLLRLTDALRKCPERKRLPR